MSRLQKLLLLEFWFFVYLPFLGGVLIWTLGPGGMFLFLFLVALWCWMIFTFQHYRYCRQEELLYVLQTAADTQAPIESILIAYLSDRPRDKAYRLWVGILLTFVFPGYYWIHKRRSFDARLGRLVGWLQEGATLSQALRMTPGLLPREIALALAVGQFSGKLSQALRRVPDRRLSLQWLEMMSRMAYPLLVMLVMVNTISFTTVFIIPKFEKIFLEFKLKLPFLTELMIACSRGIVKYGMVVFVGGAAVFLIANFAVFSSLRWYIPILGRFYRMYAHGQFLHVLGLMLETGRPLPEILQHAIDSELLSGAVAVRARAMMSELQFGRPLVDCLIDHGLATEPMRGLILTAQKANNLPWALQELGDSMIRRCATLTYRIAIVAFPLAIFACAILVGFVAVAMFIPLVEMLESLHA